MGFSNLVRLTYNIYGIELWKDTCIVQISHTLELRFRDVENTLVSISFFWMMEMTLFESEDKFCTNDLISNFVLVIINIKRIDLVWLSFSGSLLLHQLDEHVINWYWVKPKMMHLECLKYQNTLVTLIYLSFELWFMPHLWSINIFFCIIFTHY